MDDLHIRRRCCRALQIVRPLALVACLLLAMLVAACRRPLSKPTATPEALPQEIVLYNWPGYMPQELLDTFEQEYGVRVRYVTYGSMAEAERSIRDGSVAFDVAVLEYDTIQVLSAAGLLAEIDQRRVPNFEHIGASFRDLAFDPGNRHSMPFMWGSTLLIVRPDLLASPLTGWADLWDPALAGNVLAREEPDEMMGVALKSLGYSVNSDDEAELAAAGQRLMDLKDAITFVGVESAEAVAPLLSGEAAVLIGWPGDVVYAQGQNSAIQYVMPREGALLWGDALVISTLSQHQRAAELFIDFVLRPEINAMVVNAYSYATANESAKRFVQPEIAGNPIVFPPAQFLNTAEWYSVVVSPRGVEQRAEIWQRFLTARSQ